MRGDFFLYGRILGLLIDIHKPVTVVLDKKSLDLVLVLTYKIFQGCGGRGLQLYHDLWPGIYVFPVPDPWFQF